MADWHLKELDDAMRARGWQVIAVHPGDDRTISATWEVRRSTRFPSVFVDFDGMDERECLPLEEAYACGIRGLSGSSIYFGDRNKKWRDGVTALVEALDYSEKLFTLDYQIHYTGSSAAAWVYPGSIGPMEHTYIGSGLNGLARSVIDVMRADQSTRVTCSWLDEPGEIRWVLRRTGEQVSIRIFQFPKYSANLADEKGELFFETECSLIRLAGQVAAQIQRAEREFAGPGYQTRWRGEFPSNAQEEILRLIEEHGAAKI